MANETLSIRKDQARLTVVGKSKADTYIDSGLGLDLGDLDIGSLDPFDLDWEIDVPDPDNLPDEIRIISPPFKTEYKSGEKVDLFGIIVKAYKDGSVWNDPSGRYIDGLIPLAELTCEPIVIPSIDTGKTSDYGVTVKYRTSEVIPVTETTTGIHYGNHRHDNPPYTTTNSVILTESQIGPWLGVQGETSIIVVGFVREYTAYYLGTATEKYDNYYIFGVGACTNYDGRKDGFYDDQKYFVHNRKTIWISGMYGFGDGNLVVFDHDHNLLVSLERTSNIHEYNRITDTVHNPGAINLYKYLWTAVYGEENDTETITLCWERPSDKRVLKSTFNVSAYVGD